MAIRNITYTVSVDGISPATEQFGGTQEEHNATSLTFEFSPSLKSKLLEYIPDYELYYRFDIYDGEGNVLQGDSEAFFTDGESLGSVTLNLAEPASRYGGRISVYLVVTAFNEDGTALNLYSFPAKLRFNNLPDGGEGDNNAREAITTLTEAAKNAADNAGQSALDAAESENAAEIAMQQTVEARYALEHGSEFVFDGGDSENDFSIEIVIDDTLSDVSENPVQNKVIKAALDGKAENDDLPDVISNALTSFLASEDFQKAAFLANHPIESLYLTVDENDDPNETYEGTTWELVAEGRALVGVGTGTDDNAVEKTFVAEDNGGEYEHQLTVAEMPSHHFDIPARNGSAGALSGHTPDVGDTTVTNKTGYSTNTLGNDQPHNNIQPSYGVYIWKRTA